MPPKFTRTLVLLRSKRDLDSLEMSSRVEQDTTSQQSLSFCEPPMTLVHELRRIVRSVDDDSIFEEERLRRGAMKFREHHRRSNPIEYRNFRRVEATVLETHLNSPSGKKAKRPKSLAM